MKQQFNDLLIDQDLKIIEAMELIGNNSARILVVVDKNSKLLGTLTDGDIRRSIMDNIDIKSPVSEVMRQNPTTAYYETSKNELLRIMTEKSLLAIPLIDKEGVVKDIQTLISLTRVSTLDNSVLIMAGGFGKRLKPLTNEVPKPLLSIEDAPLLEKLIETLSINGFKKITIAIHYKAEMIKDYFGDGKKWGIKIDYIEETEPLGTAGALKYLNVDKLFDLPLLVLNADLVTRVDFNSLLNSHNESTSMATICVSQYEQKIPYGVIRAEDYHLLAIDEKPIEKYLINAGIYVINPEVLNIVVELDKKFDMTDVMHHVLAADHKVSVFPIHEYWKDVGEIKHFQKAKIDLKE